MSGRKATNKIILPNAILWLFLVILISAAGGIALKTSGYDLRSVWDLAATRQPERYSELYFNSPAHLPVFAAQRKPQVVPFTIVNHEHQQNAYRVETTVIVDGVSTVRIDAVTLRDGQSATEQVRFTMPGPYKSAMITVRLLGTSLQLTLRSKS